MERLTPLDASNLRVEEHGLPMTVAALAILAGSPLPDGAGDLDIGAVRAFVQSRLSRAPRLRQVLLEPAPGLGPPVWVDDPGFDISRHVRVVPVPLPGDEGALLALCSHLHQRALEPTRPLWELWLLPGLSDGRVGLLIRLHHVVADGTAALALLAAFLDLSAAPEQDPGTDWTPQPPPGRLALLRDHASRRGAGAARICAGLLDPAGWARRAGILVRQLRQLRAEGRAPATSFNRPVGDSRRLILLRADLAAARATAHDHGGKVNDIVLAAVAGGMRALLEARGELAGVPVLKASVAASLRTADDAGGGNRVGIMIVPLPVNQRDPFRQLEQVAAATARRKRLPPYQPSGRLAQRWMVHVMPRQRLTNLLVSNLAGPPMPLYFAGARILEIFQVGVVQGNLPLAVGVLSYAGQLQLALLGDTAAVPDLETVARGMAATLTTLTTPDAADRRATLT